MPSIWIMNGSTAEPSDLLGPGRRRRHVPGAPAVVLGHNGRIAWGATNVNPDTQDLFLETVDPADPTRYLFQDAAVPFDVRHETIRIAGGTTVELDVRSTRHGVVLSDVDDRLGTVRCSRCAGRPPRRSTLALETFLKVDLATSFEEFRAAFDGYGSPSQNFVYADVDGNIGYVLPGLFPIRAARRVSGSATASGTAEWTGYVPRDELPWQLNPASGQIVSANNAPWTPTTPSGWERVRPGLSGRADHVLLGELEDGAVTAEDMRRIQMDTYLGRADEVAEPHRARPMPTTADGQALWTSLTRWDRQCPVESMGCAAYATLSSPSCGRSSTTTSGRSPGSMSAPPCPGRP